MPLSLEKCGGGVRAALSDRDILLCLDACCDDDAPRGIALGRSRLAAKSKSSELASGVAVEFGMLAKELPLRLDDAAGSVILTLTPIRSW